jgi:hypothetical protein
VKVRGLFFVVLCAALAGCGSSVRHREAVPQLNRQCVGSKNAAQRDLQRRKLTADLRRLRVAAATVKGYTQNGNAAINGALDRFELDVAEESIPVQERSRYIDRAAAIVAPHCYLCFQALEANRPLAAGAKLPCG